MCTGAVFLSCLPGSSSGPTVSSSRDSPAIFREPSGLAARGGTHLLVQGLLARNVGLLRGRQRRVLAGEGAHETLKMKRTPREGALDANEGEAFLT